MVPIRNIIGGAAGAHIPMTLGLQLSACEVTTEKLMPPMTHAISMSFFQFINQQQHGSQTHISTQKLTPRVNIRFCAYPNFVNV